MFQSTIPIPAVSSLGVMLIFTVTSVLLHVFRPLGPAMLLYQAIFRGRLPATPSSSRSIVAQRRFGGAVVVHFQFALRPG